ncbi:RCC1 domain-containing protein [Streptomyces sp. NPDC056049]|uniref:RCC1 domain-containing protein n=1 Tax=Streptomyces sp. NPDC056049 TaxID=3345693 RepID=UPI0035DDDF36
MPGDLTADSMALAWGLGRTGQLGNGTTTDALSPVEVTGLAAASVVKISAGGTDLSDSFAIAVDRDGGLKAWGFGYHGQLGNDGNTSQTVPTAVSTPNLYADVAAGGMHALALARGGWVESWGDNIHGQLGDRYAEASRTAPDRVQDLPRVKQIAAGLEFSLALAADGTVYAWGSGFLGQLGNGAREPSRVPLQVPGLQNVAAIAARGHHALALLRDGTVKSWGFNASGQLGNDSTTNSTVPVDVTGLEGIATLVAGTAHNYAITTGGKVWGWGSNQHGQLLEADETFTDGASRTNRHVPVEIPRLEGAKALAAGTNYGVALFTDRIATWGHNANGQLGNGTTTGRYEDILGKGFTNITASIGGATTYAH